MKKERFKRDSQRGTSLYIVLIITSVLLAMSLGLETLLVNQLKGMKEMTNSTIAFFGADSGMERILYLNALCQDQTFCTTGALYVGDLCIKQRDLAGYSSTSPCIGLYDYSISSTPGEFSITGLGYEVSVTTTHIEESTTTFFRSKGTFKNNQRAIEASVVRK